MLDKEKDAADVVARERDYWNQHEHAEYQWTAAESIDRVVGLLPPVAGRDVLELCCGAGAFTKRVPRDYRSYTCFDISQPMLDALAKELPLIKTVQGDAGELPFPPASFDLVFVFGGLHHLPDLDKVFDGARRVLRPGGTLFAFEPNDDCWYRKFMLPVSRLLGIHTEDERFLRASELSAALGARGFRELSIRYLTPRQSREHLKTALNSALEWAMHAVSGISDAPRWQSWFIIHGKL